MLIPLSLLIWPISPVPLNLSTLFLRIFCLRDQQTSLTCSYVLSFLYMWVFHRLAVTEIWPQFFLSLPSSVRVLSTPVYTRHAVFGSHLCPVVLWPHIFSFKNRSQAHYQFYLLTSVWLLLVRQEAVLTGFLLCARGFSASVHVITVFVVLSDPLREMIDILILKIRNGVQRS